MYRASLIALLASMCAAQTGTPVASLSTLDNVMQQALSRYSVKGGSVAVVKDGRLIFARAYGWADAEAQIPAQPDSLFRWASVSKTLTAAAVMSLVDQGKLLLDKPIFGILNQYSPYNGKLGDSRFPAITVRQVLHHVAGWDRMISGDPVTGDRTITASSATRTPFPPSRDTVIRYMLAQPLEFAPGARFAYSNFGYMLLGRVIEKITGQSYASYVRDAILTPSGLGRIQPGGSTLAARLPGEVKYYDYPGAPFVSSYVSASREMEPAPYGYANFDLNDADGAWVGSVIDLAKLTALLGGARPRAPVSSAGFAAMIAETPRSTWVDSISWYGFGLFAVPQLGGITWSHGGTVPGTRAGFWHFANGICYAFLFNGDSKDQASLTSYVAQSLWDALAAVTDWPDHDLFQQYYPPTIAPAGVVNGASFLPGPVAPASFITVFGADFDAPVTLLLGDRSLPILYNSPGQLNSVLPAGAPPGDAALVVRREGWPDAVAQITIAPVSPGLFTLPYSPVVFGSGGEDVYLTLYATGVRAHRTPVTVNFGDLPVAADYAGAQPEYEGLDQVNVKLPRSLAGKGDVPVTLTVDTLRTNPVTVTFP